LPAGRATDSVRGLLLTDAKEADMTVMLLGTVLGPASVRELAQT
jgi:hypothetical protein